MLNYKEKNKLDKSRAESMDQKLKINIKVVEISLFESTFKQKH